MAADNEMDLALRITADPSQAEQALKDFSAQQKAAADSVQASNAAVMESTRAANATAQAMRRTIAESLQMQGASAEEAAQVYRQMGISGKQAAAEIASAFRGAAPALEEATAESQTFSQAVRANLVDLQALRRAFYSVFFFTSIAYLIPELRRMADEISRMSLAIGGFGTAAQDAFQKAGQAYDQFMERLKGADYTRALLQSTQKAAADIQRQIAETQAKIAQYQQAAGESADPRAVAVAIGDLKNRLRDLQEQQAENAAQEEKLSVQLAGEAVAHHAAAKAVKGHRDAQQRWAEVIATARVQLPPYIAEIDRLRAALQHADSGIASTTDLLKAQIEMAQRGLPSVQQLGFGLPTSGAPISTQIQMTQQLTEAQRLALPTERELQLANAELAREYPNLTAEERAECSQVMLTSDAYRKHIDESARVRSSNAQLSSSFRSLAQQTRTAFSEMAGQLTGWGGVATRVFDQVFNSITQQIEIEQKQAAASGAAQASIVKATVDGFKQLAPVKALIDAIKGGEQIAAALDPFDPNHAQHLASAAQWFAMAALWGTVGAFQIASMAGAFAPGGGGSKAATSAATATAVAATSSTSPALASGSASAAARENQQPGTLQVIFNGDVYGTGGIKEVVNKINTGVKFNRWQLSASHTIFGKAIR